MTEIKYCCPMREHFLIGIVGVAKGIAPADAVDFVIDFDAPKPVIAIKYCPFCGTKIDGKQPLRKIV